MDQFFIWKTGSAKYITESPWNISNLERLGLIQATVDLSLKQGRINVFLRLCLTQQEHQLRLLLGWPPPLRGTPPKFLSVTAPQMMQRLQLPDNTKRMMCHFHKLPPPSPPPHAAPPSYLMGPMFIQQAPQILTVGALTLRLPVTCRDSTHLSLRVKLMPMLHLKLLQQMYDSGAQRSYE